MSDSVLIVEDERIIALDIQSQLKRTEFEVYGSVTSAEKALDLLDQGERDGSLPSLVLMDVNLAGEMDGAEAAGIVRDRYNIPVIILTAYEDEGTLQRVKASEPLAYLVKPISGRQLDIAISLALHRHEMAKTIREKDRQLAHAQRMEAVGRMSAGLSHEYNNLVTVMMGHLRLILDDLEEIDGNDRAHSMERVISELKKNAAGLSHTITRASTLSRQLLTFSRVTSYSRELISVTRLLTEFKEMIGSVLPTSVSLSFLIDLEDTHVDAEASRLENALVNLIMNARDAVGEDGSITFRAYRCEIADSIAVFDGTLMAGTYVVFSVRDDGAGIPEDVLPHIFEPFFTTKEAGYGTGFGLASVYATATDLGGGVSVTTGPGAGTEFSIYIPAASDVHPRDLDKDRAT